MEEVLPAIRKHGFDIPERLVEKPNEPLLNTVATITQRKSYTADYLVAINYYNEDELKTFLTYFNDSLRLVIQHINAIHIKATSDSVIQMLLEPIEFLEDGLAFVI